MRLTVLFAILIWCGSARADSLLGQTMLGVGRAALARTGISAAGNLAEELPLQDARGESTSAPRALTQVSNGNLLVDAASWVVGHGLVEALLPGAFKLASPLVSALVANLGGELSAYAADTAYQHRPVDPIDLVGRSLFCAIGSAVGAVLLPGVGPIIGAWVGMTVAEIMWEHARRGIERPQAHASKPVEWYAGDAPPLGAYRAPTLRGAPLLGSALP